MIRRKAASGDLARLAIRQFLDVHYAATHPDEVGPLLGQLSLLGDARPVDPDCRRLWNEAVSRAVAGVRAGRMH
jgi:hypothetical protein